MREHPIPQDIVGYRFHIVGNMTIKQFAEVGAGCLLAFIIYSTNLVAFIKWPMIGLSVAIGAAAAFVPIEERPLDHWIITLIKVLYKPTKYFWKREARIPDLFFFEANKTSNQEIELDLTPYRQERIREFLRSVHTEQEVQLDAYEQYRVDRINQILSTFGDYVGQEQGRKPDLKNRVRQLRADDAVFTASLGQAGAEYQSQEYEEVEEDEYQSKYQDIQSTLTLRAPLEVTQVATDITMPDQNFIETNLNQKESQTVAFAEEHADAAHGQAYSDAHQTYNHVSGVSDVQTNQNLPFPNQPTEPNKLVGMALTPNNDIIPKAIIKILDESGKTVRAIKTNPLGQFFISEQLNNGNYTIVTEKQGFQFYPQSLQLNGKVVAPIELRSVA